MNTLHYIAAYLVVIANIVAGLWGIAVLRVAGGDAGNSGAGQGMVQRWYPHVLVASHYLIVVVGVLGLLSAAGGSGADDRLHARVYGPFMLVAVAAGYGFRTTDQRWNVRVFTIIAWIVAALGARAIQTG